MSTNYYFQINSGLTTSDNVSIKVQDYLFNQVDSELHIGKKSAGWPPLFRANKFYSSVKEMKEFYEENKDCLTIVDEYEDRELSWRDLESELINWNKDNKDAIVRLIALDMFRDEEGYNFTNAEFC